MSRSLSTVRSTKRIHHEYVTQCRVFLRQRFFVFLFAFVETNVFQNNQFTCVQFNAV
ncbi:Uncharacterised protein [Vibrio cholerae]|nr:Uncharacterised protein [Vibrio cholerae]